MNLSHRRCGVVSMLVGILLQLAAGSELAHASDMPVDANSLRGVWLERFTRFIDWPTGHRVTQTNQPLELCVIDDSKFADLLITLYAKQTIKGKVVRVHALDAAAAMAHCDLLFLAEVPASTRDAILQRAISRPMLIVSASSGYAEAGSHINLYEEDGFLRFEINLEAVQKAGLTVSSHLLKIARIVRQKEAR